MEVNVLGRDLKQGKPIKIFGESKVKLSKNDVDAFIRKKVKPISSTAENLFPVLITHMVTSPDVEEYARKKGLRPIIPTISENEDNKVFQRAKK